MKYCIVGKQGACINTIIERVETLSGRKLVQMPPAEKYDENIEVFYIDIPLAKAWDWFMECDPYNKTKSELFCDELMKFRNFKAYDYIFEYTDDASLNKIVDKICMVMRGM